MDLSILIVGPYSSVSDRTQWPNKGTNLEGHGLARKGEDERDKPIGSIFAMFGPVKETFNSSFFSVAEIKHNDQSNYRRVYLGLQFHRKSP